MNNLVRKFMYSFNEISEYYHFLVNKTKNHEYVDINNEWIIDNYYLLVEHKSNILNQKKDLIKYSKMIKKNYHLLETIVIENNYNISFKILTNELRKIQKSHNKIFSYQELLFVIPTLIFIYTDKLRDLCYEECDKIINKSHVSSIIKENEDLDIQKFIDERFDIKNNVNYIFEINNQLSRLGNKSNKLFKDLNKYLSDCKINIKTIINDEYNNKMNNNILISNIFSNLKDFFEYNTENLFKKVSLTEKLLLTDETYKCMTVESKLLYRQNLVKLAKRHHKSEYEYLESIFDSKEHIGYKIIKQKKNKLRFIAYLICLVLFTTVFTFILSNFFIKPRIIGFIVLFIPVYQLVSQVFNEILNKISSTSIIPKLDYSKGIPDNSRTMVVIPTIISSKEKISDMFETLEYFYLVNKTKNLYFTLLGDVKASDQQVTDYDAEISEYGTAYAKKLNKKYKKDIFFFVYRKRVWNELENSYLGYERKRGALVQFNKILLGKKVDNHKYFNVNMLDGKNLGIKYVLTLDTDTKLVLNSALNLVGAMAHPLNKAILNKEKTKVIKGYGLMQPRVSVDIEATNKSLYSQIFAGIGGFDTYSSVVPNIFQDNFGEGSFVGKGIYDLETFEQVLGDTLPDNLILSHDLLEGNYLRCGYISDIEFIDDFPAKFLTDVTRHHRWARGDTQIIGWLLNKVRNKKNQKVKNPINLLGKYKILDNVIRMFLNPMLLLILLLSFTLSLKKSLFWIWFVILEIAISIVFFLRSKMVRKGKNKQNVYYKQLYFGGKSLILRAYVVLCTIPYYAKLYMDAFFRALYRMFVSHRNLLNWITAEEVEKTVSGSLKSYMKNFVCNFVFALVFIAIGIFSNNFLAYLISLTFISAPFILWDLSKEIDHNQIQLKDKKLNELNDLAYHTWKYFEDNLCSEYNYLIPDNYQENRENKLDMRTSPTAIGYSLVSCISAYELDYISLERTTNLLGKILNTIDSLDKWHGHLYNWYNIETKKVMYPNFVSTVDSGNLVGCIVVAREFLDKNQCSELVDLCDKLISNTNFKKLYTKKNVFSIGYDDDEARLSIYNYNKFASESRLTSYLAICLGNIPIKHWFCLDKSLTIYNHHKGLISWSGTSFEYYMPLLFMRNYPNTLFDESYSFARFCQKEYIQKISHKLPWGISECAYNELDNSLNYKYRAFATPYLKAKEEKDNRIVLSPYASIMALELFPEDVYNNINKFKKLGMYSDYGLYESYDYDNNGIVKAYFAHHQGMILLGITNYLKKGAIKNYFHSNINIRTFELLLKEKVQIKTTIDMKIAGYKKYDYNKETIENDIRSFNYISYLPEMTVLSNRKYSLIMNDRGNSFSKYRNLQLNRYRKVTELDYGIFLFTKDLKNNHIWSNTYAPMNTKPDKYEVVFASDKIKFLRKDGDISTKTEIVVCDRKNVEIRKITFKNDSNSDKKLELTSYTEPILCNNMDDISHKVFNNMFIHTRYDIETNSLIAKRKNRNNSINSYMVMKMFISDNENDYSYETERSTFIGRGNLLSCAIGLTKPLSNYTGDNLDPILSLRNQIVVPAESSKSIYLIVGFGRSSEQIREIVENYNSVSRIEKAFQIAPIMNIIDTKTMNITGENMRTFNMMLNYIYQTTRFSVLEERMDNLRKNAYNQTGLWKYGISGDRPIISIEITDISNISFVFEILKVFEYFKNKSIFIDALIINSEKGESKDIINREIDNELYRMYTLNSFYHTPGNVFVIDGDDLTEKDRSLLAIVPRLNFNTDKYNNLKDAVFDINKKNIISEIVTTSDEINLPIKKIQNLSFDNGYGGFINNGREYVIYNKNTPTPWSNIIANKNFGTVVTNNGCGYTYAYSSSEFKISSWTNEMLINDKSEGFKFNQKTFNPEKCIHGFGYSILESETKSLKHEITEFVALDDNVKLYLMKLTNKEKAKQMVNIEYWINPTLGNFEEKTARHILAEFNGDDNYLKMRNVYSIDFSNVNVFASSNERINSCEYKKMLIKNISIDVELNGLEEKYIVFALGCSLSDEENIKLINKYTNIDNALKELELVKEYWAKILNVVEVETPDESFNYVMNGWYLYQTICARVFAKAGFYQVSGAFGYRDQLQDSMNVVSVTPDITRKQILDNASHQFYEGDVLHWWHEKNHFGLRSRYRDDYLWLVYSTIQYIKTTLDYDILNEQVPYINGETLKESESEKGMVFSYSDKKETLLNHCLKSLELSMSSIGSHGLPLMGGGDWNDGMNLVGIRGNGESVWLGFFLYNIIDLFKDIISHYDKKFDLDRFIKFNDKLKKSLNDNAWDGEYYLRAFYDNGNPLGSHYNDECKIDLISQSFAILSDVIPKDRIESVIDSVETKLVDNKNNIIKLLDPPFKKSPNNPGYIMNYPEGIRENGGQYTHSVSWYLMSLIKIGKIDLAYKYYQMINPINRTLNSKDVDKYKVEPYVIVADIYSNKQFEGRGGWTWYTGSAGWFYKVGLNDILGIQRNGDKLIIKPHIPREWDGYKIKYHYLDTLYQIEIIRGRKSSVKLDNKIVTDINLVNDHKHHQIKIIISK